MKKIETVYNGKKQVHVLYDKATDDCPICDTPLEHTTGTWNMFHGEVSAQCCGAPYQTKDYYVDPEKSEGYDKFFEELNKPGVWSISIPEEWVGPYHEAFKQLNVDRLTKEVTELAEKIKEGKV